MLHEYNFIVKEIECIFLDRNQMLTLICFISEIITFYMRLSCNKIEKKTIKGLLFLEKFLRTKCDFTHQKMQFMRKLNQRKHSLDFAKPYYW